MLRTTFCPLSCFLATFTMKIKEVNPFISHLKSKTKEVGLSSFRLYNKKDHRFENLSEEEYQAFLSLSKNNDIIIQKAGKVNTVVALLDRSSNIKKMEELLADTSKFVKVEFNKKHKLNQELRHLLDLQGNIKTCLDNLLEKQYISREDYNFLKPCGSRPGILYRLWKVHKGRGASNDLPPFWPILSAIGILPTMPITLPTSFFLYSRISH